MTSVILDSIAVLAPLPATEAFSSGNIVEEDMTSGLQQADSWGADPINIALIVMAVMTILFLRRLVDVLPWLFKGLFSFRKLLAMQQSMRLIRERNSLTLMMLLCLCLVASRYGLYAPDFFSDFSPGAQSLCIIAAMLAVGVFRRLLLSFFALNTHVGGETLASANHCAHDFIITAAVVLIPLCPILDVLTINHLIIKTLSYDVLLVLYIVFLVRKGQFLSKFCKQFNTILYLCGLEILPVGMLILSAILL